MKCELMKCELMKCELCFKGMRQDPPNISTKEHCKTLKIDETKYDYRKAVVQLDQPDLCNLMKLWETLINGYLKGEGIPPITIVYGNKIYLKTMIHNPTNVSIIKIKSVWINDENKPFLQLWLK